jgi:stearoyl-CoA desaturase (delta-9 desaturase)
MRSIGFGVKAVRALLFANIALMVALPAAGLVDITAPGMALAVALYALFGCAGVVATYHRGHAHRSYRFRSRWLEILFTLFGMLSGSGSALGWCAVHRRHHDHPDTEDDPHSPVHGAWATLTVKYSYDEEGNWSNVRDLLKKPYMAPFHRWYFPILGVYVLALLAAAGVPGWYYGFILPNVLVMAMSGITNYFAHLPAVGYKNYPHGEDTNVPWLAYLNFGEGWHNNHHADPDNYTTKHKWWEFDPAGSIIRLVKA